MIWYLNFKLDINLSRAKDFTEHKFNGDFVYKLKKIVDSHFFSAVY